MNVDRRKLLAGTLGAVASTAIVEPALRPKYSRSAIRQPPISRVAILRANTYSDRLEVILMGGLRLFRLDVRNKSVLLKPNMVDYSPKAAINTHPTLIGAAADCFLRMGARRVTVSEGPGHQRDTELLLGESGLGEELGRRGIPFVDLNRDELVKTKLLAHYTGLDHLWLPRTVLETDFLVSMPKVKTHHWAGVTLSMKNMFGIVPGMRYGWPKNILHWHGIHNSILDICATVPIHFVIADAIVCMEGNGPLHGTARRLDTIVVADDPVAADARCARLMGLVPEHVAHVSEAAKFVGNLSGDRIQAFGEPMPNVVPFSVIPGAS